MILAYKLENVLSRLGEGQRSSGRKKRGGTSAARRNIYWPLTIISEARKQMDTLGLPRSPLIPSSKRPRSFPSLRRRCIRSTGAFSKLSCYTPSPCPSHWPFRFFFSSSFSIFLLCFFPLLLSFCFSLSSKHSLRRNILEFLWSALFLVDLFFFFFYF